MTDSVVRLGDKDGKTCMEVYIKAPVEEQLALSQWVLLALDLILKQKDKVGLTRHPTREQVIGALNSWM